MKALIDILKKETESLKIQYVEMTKEWAVKEFNYLKKWAADYHKGVHGFDEASKKYYRLPYYIVNSNGTVEQHINKMVASAIEHYEFSIQKLALRIEKKGLNINNLTTVTAHEGVNIETTLTDGVKTVRAITIIATG